MEKHICLAVSGASGFVYAERLLKELLNKGCIVHLLMTDAAREVARLEHDLILPDTIDELKSYYLNMFQQQDNGQLRCYDRRDWLSPVASGSAPIEAMVVCPCSTGTLASIANGHSNNLIERAATVCLKEKRQLIIVPREAPLSAIQLEHMHKLALLGVGILPASPGFYNKPKSIDDLIDFVVARIMQQLNLPQTLMPQWGMDE